MIRKTTLTVCPGNEARALEIATRFRTEHPTNHRRHSAVAHRHGVIFVYMQPSAKFYAYGWDGHVRVVEEDAEP